jgi:hypothetical protein
LMTLSFEVKNIGADASFSQLLCITRHELLREYPHCTAKRVRLQAVSRLYK